MEEDIFWDKKIIFGGQKLIGFGQKGQKTPKSAKMTKFRGFFGALLVKVPISDQSYFLQKWSNLNEEITSNVQNACPKVSLIREIDPKSVFEHIFQNLVLFKVKEASNSTD